VRGDEAEGRLPVSPLQRVDDGRVQGVPRGDVLLQRLFAGGEHGQGVRLDLVEQAAVERAEHGMRADRGDAGVQ
jgi:hypothetical protein